MGRKDVKKWSKTWHYTVVEGALLYVEGHLNLLPEPFVCHADCHLAQIAIQIVTCMCILTSKRSVEAPPEYRKNVCVSHEK